MDSLWENVAKLNFSKGEKNIRDQIGESLKLVKEGKITNQEFIGRMAAIAEDKPVPSNDEERI